MPESREFAQVYPNPAIKDGVDVSGLKPEALLAVVIASHVFAARRIPFVLTSVSDGVHMAGSHHYSGLAFDCRLPSRAGFDSTADMIIAVELRKALGSNYDAVLETDHIHVEFDPHNPTLHPV